MKEQSAFREHGSLAMEAVKALACLDADRLEDLVRSCRMLDPELESATSTGYANLRRELAVLSSVLETTHSNACVLRRLRASSSQYLEYRCEPESGWVTLWS